MKQSNTFFQLASALSLVQQNGQEEHKCRTLFSKTIQDSSVQWEFFEYCKKWKLAPWIYIQLNRLKLLENLDSEVQNTFAEHYQMVFEQNKSRNKTAIQFLKRFQEEQIDCIILKGNCLAHEVYQEIGYKRMNDFDILIHKKDWDRIQSIYLELGYIPLGFGWNGEKEKPAKFSHVGMSFISPDFTCIIGSQWGLKSPTTVYKDQIAGAWESALPFDFYGVSVKQLSPEHHLLHLILHMGIFKSSIRDCMDVFNLMRSKEMNIDTLIQLLKNANAVEKAVFTLKMSDVSAEGVASDVLNGLDPNEHNFVSKRLKDRLELHDQTGDYQMAYNDYFQDIEKEVIYFNVFPHFHRKLYFYLRIIGFIFCPKKSIVLKLNDLQQSAPAPIVFLRRFSTPGRIFSLIAQEIGWKFTCFLFVKLGLDVLFSLKNYIIHKPSYFDYLKSKNIDINSLKKIIQNIQ